MIVFSEPVERTWAAQVNEDLGVSADMLVSHLPASQTASGESHCVSREPGQHHTNQLASPQCVMVKARQYPPHVSLRIEHLKTRGEEPASMMSSSEVMQGCVITIHKRPRWPSSLGTYKKPLFADFLERSSVQP